jgi:hypothetical protein
MADDAGWEAFGGGPSGRASARGFEFFAAAAERFAAAATQYFAAVQTPPPAGAHTHSGTCAGPNGGTHTHSGTGTHTNRGTGTAAAAFIDALRDQFSDVLRAQWSAGTAWVPGGSPVPLMADAPALGLTREHQERAQRAAGALSRMQEAQRRLQRLCADALLDAATAFASRLGPAPGGTLGAEALHGLYDAWIDCAEDAYARVAHGEAFCDALAEHVNASSDWRREASAAVEQWSKWLDLPTRSEFNSLAERLRSLEQKLSTRSGQSKTPRKPRATRRRVER